MVIGISGGKDSGVVLALFVKALGRENVVGLTLPCHSLAADKTLAKQISEYYGIKLYNLDLTGAYDSFTKEVLNEYGKVDENFLIDSNINLKPRLRMSALYYYAAMLSKINGKTYIAAGTSNKCELFVGYFTKGGDSVHDISTIADFTVEETIKIGEYLKVPAEILYRTPSDGLSGMSDEDKLGVKYSEITNYINNEGGLTPEIKKKIENLHNASLHKFNIPTYRRK